MYVGGRGTENVLNKSLLVLAFVTNKVAPCCSQGYEKTCGSVSKERVIGIENLKDKFEKTWLFEKSNWNYYHWNKEKKEEMLNKILVFS